MKILIVDDLDENLYMLNSLLSAYQYEITECKNGKEALEKLGESPYDLIISDVLMPVMDGFSLCIEIKKIDQYKNIPFIFYTATYTSKKDEAFAYQIGADRFIVKPCEPDEFIIIIQGVLDEKDRLHHFTKTQDLSEDHIREENQILKLYNERLVNKLEQKMLQLETELKAKAQTEKRLIRQETLLNQTQKITKLAGWEYDIYQKELFWTQEVYNIHDIDPEELIDQKNEIIQQRSIKCYPPGVREDLEKNFLECMNTGKPFDMESDFISEKGRKLIIRTFGEAVIENGVIVKLCGYIQDCTEKRKIQEEQEKIKDQFLQSQKLDSLGHLAGGIAHDFNNILMVILGYCDIILQSVEPEFEFIRELAEIKKVSNRAAELTKQLLIFSRKHISQPKIMNLNILIKDLYNMINRLIGEHIQIDYHLNPALPNIKADPGQINQVIMNLVINSRDAMPKGGLISIETLTRDQLDEHYFDFCPHKDHNCVILKISDNGLGMTKEVMDKIFEPFFTTKEQGKGTGLGLSTVYGIINQAEGFIKVESEPNKGTSFMIFLPASSEVIDYKRELLQENDMQGNGELILLAEDDQTLRDLIQKMLKKLGYRSQAYENGHLLLNDLSGLSEIPQLLITDMVMPGLSGKELAKQVSALLPDLKVLFISGYSDNILLNNDSFFPNGPFIHKPFSVMTLAKYIKLALE